MGFHPYMRKNIRRFGKYDHDMETLPDPLDPRPLPFDPCDNFYTYLQPTRFIGPVVRMNDYTLNVKCVISEACNPVLADFRALDGNHASGADQVEIESDTTRDEARRTCPPCPFLEFHNPGVMQLL